MEPVVVTVVFYLAVALLCVARPNAGRIFVGVFFLIMAWGVHGYFILADPQGYVSFAEGFSIGFYRDVAIAVVEVSPVGFGVVMLLFETAVGLLILSKGRYVKLGLLAGVVFLVGIAPWGVVTVTNLILAAGMAFLLTKRFDRSPLDRIWTKLTHDYQREVPA